jgi:2-succinyl-6-hydroxy-2,4-cyclohexadiene-1-carboxylate synthase
MKLTEYTGHRQQSDTRSALLFVHGLLGDRNDWQEVVNHVSTLSSVRCFGVELPGHGDAQIDKSVEYDFDWISLRIRELCNSLIADGVDQLVLVGYSLGARLMMYALTRNYLSFPQLKSVVIEGGNFGLDDPQQIKERAENDEHWAQRFETLNAQQVLDMWYQQPVFSDISKKQRQALIDIRKKNDLASVATLMRATSLAKQPNLLHELQSHPTPTVLVVGENDTKFRLLYEDKGIPTLIVPNAGHNTHKDNPKFMALALVNTLTAVIKY